MTTLHLTEEQLRLVQRALDFYSRVGIGQFEEIKNHPTFSNHLQNEFKDESGKTDYGRYHDVRDVVDSILVQPRNMLCNDPELPRHGSWGIFNPDVDESCRVAYDIIQVIRHEFWKADSDRSEHTVDSSVHLHTEDGDKIKCEL
jgi:hypothetical protein